MKKKPCVVDARPAQYYLLNTRQPPPLPPHKARVQAQTGGADMLDESGGFGGDPAAGGLSPHGTSAAALAQHKKSLSAYMYFCNVRGDAN